MKFVDLAAQQSRIRDRIDGSIKKVLDHGNYIMGPEIGEIEKRLADYAGCKHGLACGSGTDALLLALMALGIGPGDAVLTSPFTFIATAEVVALLGATTVFVDIDHRTYNIDPDSLEEALGVLSGDRDHPVYRHHRPEGPLTPKAIIAVNLFGAPADYDRINTIADNYRLAVIEDAAQSFGAEYKGRMSCSLGDISCTSFFPAKPLGCYGDGGMCFTDDDHHIQALTSLRIHGKGRDKYDNVRIGINGRMDTLQAAILLEKFSIFPEEVRLRNDVAYRYHSFLADHERLTIPSIPDEAKSVWAQYSILAEDDRHRTLILNTLKAAGIPTAIYYPTPLHLQTAFKGLGYQSGDFPVSENVSRRVFSLPMHPYLKIADQKKIAQLLRQS